MSKIFISITLATSLLTVVSSIIFSFSEIIYVYNFSYSLFRRPTSKFTFSINLVDALGENFIPSSSAFS